MELYASRRLMFDCMMAAKFPTTMVASAQTHIAGAQRDAIGSRPPRKIRSSTANAAAFGPTVRNAATGAGAPWYTSGAQLWKGAAEILNASPTKMSAAATPISVSGGGAAEASIRRISVRLVDPVAPYIQAIPYRRNAVANEPSRKYFRADSLLRASSRR